MPAYDSNLFDPPAPVASVTIRDPRNGNTQSEVLMLIDTGADITLVPKHSVNQLESDLDPRAHYELRGFDGNRSFAQSVELDLLFLEKTFKGRFLIVDSQADILGRDILNLVIITLDGPQRTWQEGAR